MAKLPAAAGNGAANWRETELRECDFCADARDNVMKEMELNVFKNAQLKKLKWVYIPQSTIDFFTHNTWKRMLRL